MNESAQVSLFSGLIFLRDSLGFRKMKTVSLRTFWKRGTGTEREVVGNNRFAAGQTRVPIWA